MAFKKKAIAPDVREYLNQGRTLKDIEQSLGKSLFGYVQREDEYMNLYSQNLYSGVNRDLRSPNPKPDLQISASAIQDTLATMPNYEGISYRGISVANLEDALNQFGISKGADYIDPAFTSYSENLDIAKDFAKKSISNRDRIIFTTSSKSGSLMGSYAQHDFEKEILFPAGFPQRVKSVDIKREGISNVAYVELADTPESAKFLKDFGLSDKKKSIKEAIANPAIASQILRDELSVQPRNFLSTQKKNFGGEISVKDNASNFEFGQKFIAPKTGEIVSLSAINDDGSVVLRDRKNVAIEVPLKDFGKYKVKPMPNLDDLNAGDGLVKIAKAKNNFGSLVEGDRLTVQAVDGDIIRGFTDTGNYQVLSRSKIQESFRPNPLGFATFPAITSGLLGTTGIAGGATAGKLLAKSLGANEDQQNVAAGIGGAIGGLTGVTTGYIGDGVTMPKSFRDMAKRAMGVKSNSEAGMVAPISMFEPPKRKSGLLYLPNYLTIADQKDLLNDLRTVVRQSPLFTPTMSSGAPFRYKMTNIGDLGWNSDRKGYRYESKHPVTGQPYPEIPSSLRSMIDDLSGKFGEKIRPDAVLLNWYPDGAKLGLHVDSTEKVSKPVVSLSLGDRGVFAIDTTGSRDRSTATKSLERINVNSGDAIVFGGDLRNAYHAVERIDAGTAPPELGMKNSGRINLTARQVNKISGGGFGNSVSKLAKGFAMREGARLLAKQLGADEQQQQAVADTVTAANVLGSVYQNATKKSGVKSNSEAGMVAPNKVGDQILDSLNPTGGIFAGYSPEARVKAKLAKNIKTLADTMRVSPDDLITVYRGSAFQDSINDGDFVTTNKQLAKDYAGGGKVLSQTVRYGDILDDINEPLGDEYILRKGAYEQINSRSADKKINTGSVSSSVKEPKMPKLTTDTLYKYLQMMGGDPVIVKPDGSQATKGKFAFGQDIGLNNEFTKLPEIHTRFDDPKIASMVAKELATGELTVGMQRNPETGEIETVTKKFQPIPSRGNTQLRRYSLSNDPSGAYIAFNKPEEAYKAPKSLKELQADTRKAYQSFGLKPNATIAELQAAVQPIVNEVRASQDLRDRLATVLVDMKNRPELEPVPLERGWDKVQSRSPMTQQVMQQAAIASAPPQSPPLPSQSSPSKASLKIDPDRLGGYDLTHADKIEKFLQNEDNYRSVLGALSNADQDKFNMHIENLDDGDRTAIKELIPYLNKARQNTPSFGGGFYEDKARIAFNELDQSIGKQFGFNNVLERSLPEFVNSNDSKFRVDIGGQAKVEVSRTKVNGRNAFKVDNIVAYDSAAVGDRFAMKTLKYLQQNLPDPVVMGNVVNPKFRSIFEKQGYINVNGDFLPPELAPKQAIAPNIARDTGGWANAQGESLVTLENVDQKRKQVAAERSAYANQKAPFASQRLTEVDRYGVGAPLDDEAAYNLAKRKFETIKRSALEFPDTFQGVDQSAKFPSFSNLKRQALSEGIMLADSGTNAFKAYADAKAAELTGTLKIPESGLPVTARLGQEYISPKTGKIGTVESVGKKGVKLNVDGQVVPLEYQTLERLKYTGNKGYGFSTPAALRPANAGLFGGTLGAIAFKQLAKAAGLNEDQQNIAAGVGGVTGAITGGSLSLFKPTTELKAPTARQFAQSVMGVPAPSESGMFLSAEGRNKMRLNQLNQYDVKPVLSDAAVLATDLLTPHPYGIATVPAARMAAESWKNNYDAIAERGLKAMKTTATGATAAVKDFTYQTLSQLGRSVGLPFPMTEQAVGQVLDAIPNADQVMGMAKSRFARNSESGMVMMGDRPQTLSELQRQPDRPQTKGFSNPQSELAIGRRELDAKYPYSPPYDRTAKPEPRKPVPYLTFDQSADQMSMSPSEYRAFQDRVYAEQQAVQSKPYQERQNQIAKQKFQQVQSYSDALKAWNKAGDPTIPMPRKEDFVSPIKNTFDFKQTLSEASMAARSAESRVKGFSKPQPKSAIAQATQAIKNAGEIVFDALYQPSAANPSRASLPKQSTFIAESEVQKAAAATGVSEARVKAEIANQRASGESPSLGKVTEAIATRTQSKELAPRSLKELQSKELSPRVLSRQQPDGMIVAPSQKMIDAGLKDQKVKLSDRIGASGLGVFMDTAQAANVLTESVRRGENAPTALTRAGVSVGAGYAATGLASFISNPYLRTAAQLGGGIAAVIGADKAIDQIVGRNEAKEQKYAKDLSKLDLQPIEDKEQWKPFANDSNIAAAYGNSLTAQIQQNLDYRPAARSLANLANRDAIENARYQSERQTSLQTGMDAKSGKKTIAFEKRDDGTEVGYLRNRGYNATESRVLALQNLANESGYETPRTGKFDAKTLDALEKLGYSQSQISAYIKGKTKAIGKPNQVTPDKVNAVKIALARSRGEQVSSSQLSAALSAERKAQGLKAGQMLDQSQVDNVFRSLAGRSLSDLRRSQSPIKSKPLQRFGSAVGIGK